MKFPFGTHITSLLAASVFTLAAWQSQAQEVSREVLADTLADGGYVIVMRHANSPRELPDAATANDDNVNGERQLDEVGRQDAQAMGEALRRHGIVVEEVLASPTYRALETARLMGFETVESRDELSNEGMRAAGAEKAAWLKEQVAEAAGGTRLLITHGPNLSAAFPDHSQGMTEGEALIFDPQGPEGPAMIHRIRIGDWGSL